MTPHCPLNKALTPIPGIGPLLSFFSHQIPPNFISSCSQSPALPPQGLLSLALWLTLHLHEPALGICSLFPGIPNFQAHFLSLSLVFPLWLQLNPVAQDSAIQKLN